MARFHIRDVVQDNLGDSIQGASVYIFAADGAAATGSPPTGTVFAGQMWSAATGGSTITSPLTTDALGQWEAWLDTAQSISTIATDSSGAAVLGSNNSVHPTITQKIVNYEAGEPHAKGHDYGSATDHLGILGLPCDIVIYNDGGTYKAKDARTGQVTASSSAPDLPGLLTTLEASRGATATKVVVLSGTYDARTNWQGTHSNWSVSGTGIGKAIVKAHASYSGGNNPIFWGFNVSKWWVEQLTIDGSAIAPIGFRCTSGSTAGGTEPMGGLRDVLIFDVTKVGAQLGEPAAAGNAAVNFIWNGPLVGPGGTTTSSHGLRIERCSISTVVSSSNGGVYRRGVEVHAAASDSQIVDTWVQRASEAQIWTTSGNLWIKNCHLSCGRSSTDSDGIFATGPYPTGVVLAGIANCQITGGSIDNPPQNDHVIVQNQAAGSASGITITGVYFPTQGSWTRDVTPLACDETTSLYAPVLVDGTGGGGAGKNMQIVSCNGRTTAGYSEHVGIVRFIGSGTYDNITIDASSWSDCQAFYSGASAAQARQITLRNCDLATQSLAAVAGVFDGPSKTWSPLPKYGPNLKVRSTQASAGAIAAVAKTGSTTIYATPHRAIDGANLTTWAATTAYTANTASLPANTAKYVVPTGGFYVGYIFECTTAGTTGANEPAWITTPGNTVADGSVTWTCRAVPAAFPIPNNVQLTPANVNANGARFAAVDIFYILETYGAAPAGAPSSFFETKVV